MKMIKIFKRISFFVLILVITLSLTSCSENVQVFEDGIDVHISDSLKEYMLHPDNLPTLHFDYNGVSASVESEGAAYFFVHNNQLELSEKFAEHLERYSDDQIFIISCEEQTLDYKEALFDGEKLLLDEVDSDGNEQNYSKEYQIVAVNDDGTRYSYQYRTFTHDGKDYYIFRYTSNIGIAMEQSLMVVETTDGDRKIVLVPLPYDVKYEISFSTAKLKNLITKDYYLEEKYYKFAYTDMFNQYNEEDRDKKVIEWYKNYNLLESDTADADGAYYLNYYGVKFKLTFGYSDCGKDQNKDGFKLEFVE